MTVGPDDGRDPAVSPMIVAHLRAVGSNPHSRGSGQETEGESILTTYARAYGSDLALTFYGE